jgi:signal transduction histidine kinase
MLRTETGKSAGVETLLRDVTRERELDQIKSEFISTAAHECYQ